MRNRFRFTALILVVFIVQIANISANRFRQNENIKSRLLTEDDGCGIPPKLFKKVSVTSTTQPSSPVDKYEDDEIWPPVKEEEEEVIVDMVVGGDAAIEGDYPWMALLGYKNNFGEKSWKCGGSLITSRHVLTAAHCVTSTLFLARFGEYNITSTDDGPVQDIRIIRTEIHPFYNRRNAANDIAILHLEQDVQFNTNVWPICLPLSETYQRDSFKELLTLIAGWGRVQEEGNSSDVLQTLYLPILKNSECKKQFRKQGKLISENQFDKTVICAGDLNGGHDSCKGDSGGPMMHSIQEGTKWRIYQIGIISYGIIGCARVDSPAVYTRVSEFIDWIQDVINP